MRRLSDDPAERKQQHNFFLNPEIFKVCMLLSLGSEKLGVPVLCNHSW